MCVFACAMSYHLKLILPAQLLHFRTGLHLHVQHHARFTWIASAYAESCILLKDSSPCAQALLPYLLCHAAGCRHDDSQADKLSERS